MSDLESEISERRREISAETISMSVSELTSLYREGTLEIWPEFQRLFRWTDEQKSRLIESVLLGIPLPSLFVAQSDAGKWELVDGLQRVSTLLQLQGALLSPGGGYTPELRLRGTKYLPSLEGRSWSDLTDAQKLDVRLARLDLRVIRRDSDTDAKFDLFQRLNSFGSSLTAQEVRSAMIAGTRADFLRDLLEMAHSNEFAESVMLSERLTSEQYDVELVLRFLMLHNIDLDLNINLRDFSARLDDWSLVTAQNWEARRDSLVDAFMETFSIVADGGGENVFRKWDSERGQFRGSFSNTAFEVIALGLGYHVAKRQPYRTDVLAAAQELWELPIMTPRFTTGLGTHERLRKTLDLGRKLMAQPRGEIVPEDLVVEEDASQAVDFD